MISIQPTHINFKQDNTQSTKDKSKYDTALVGAAATVLAGSAVLIGRKLSIKSLSKLLSSQGAELKDGVAVLSKTGEKFTGTVKRRVGSLGLKRETIKFEEGLMAEKIYHDIFGRELEGEFYKAGILRLRVGPGKNYSMVKFDSKGKCEAMSECKTKGGVSKFESARNILSSLKE